MRHPVATVLIAGLALSGSASLAAQAPATGQRTGLCFRGRPADRCGSFFIVESGINYRLNNRQPTYDSPVMLSYGLGFLVNSGSRHAIGGQLFAVIEEDARAGVAARWRRWLDSRNSLDLTAGLSIIGDNGSGGGDIGLSPMVQVKLNHADLIAATARLEAVRGRGCANPSCTAFATQTNTRVYVGAEFGSWAGIGGYVASGILFVIALAAWSGS